MFDLIREIFISPAGSFGSMFALSCLIFYICYKTGRTVERFEVVAVLEKNIEKIKEDISGFKAFIQIFNQSKNPFAQRQSPISLTERGTKVSNELNVNRLIESNWNSLYERIKSNLKKNVNPYDIQEVCFKIGEKYSDIILDDEFESIKNYAFKNGYNLSDFDIIFGIVIRDIYLKKEGINLEEVDAHDPKNTQ